MRPCTADPTSNAAHATLRLLPAVAVMFLACSNLVSAAPEQGVQLDPFARATAGDPACPEVPPPLLDAADARSAAHARVERGLRCAMDGTCAPGGSYRRDPQINDAVRAAIAADPRFARTSVWLTTSRQWVTLQGCVRNGRAHRALVDFVRAQPDVTRVFDELRPSAPAAPAPHAAPRAWPARRAAFAMMQRAHRTANETETR